MGLGRHLIQSYLSEYAAKSVAGKVLRPRVTGYGAALYQDLCQGGTALRLLCP